MGVSGLKPQLNAPISVKTLMMIDFIAIDTIHLWVTKNEYWERGHSIACGVGPRSIKH